MFNWQLNTNNFSTLDRLKICGFFLNSKNFWTQNKYVRQYEKMATDYVGAKHAVLVSSGSSANQLICQYIKDDLIEKGLWPQKNKVVLCAVTWQTNASVWIREGFDPIFIDINLNDFSIDYNKLSSCLQDNHSKVACVFPTSLIGYTPNIPLLKSICEQYQVRLMLDNCENSEGTILVDYRWKNLCSLTTCTTSIYIAHQWSSGQEGGFIFTNDDTEYEYFLLSRAHGLRRNLTGYVDDARLKQYTNSLVDRQFDFQTLSSNYRSTDIVAFCGILDFKKNARNRELRIKLYSLFKDNLDDRKFFLPPKRWQNEDVAFCLPIITNNLERCGRVKALLKQEKIEYRPIVSGNMLRQRPYQKYANYKDFINAEYLHNFGIYIGLHPQVREQQILDLTKKLNIL